MRIYDYPLYYEIAFSFFDVKQQIDFFESIVKKFSKIKVKRFLDLACGPSLQLREIARRGYQAVGIDENRKMLVYLSQRASLEGLKIEAIKKDFSDFRIKSADFAFIMMGSFTFKSNDQFMRHLDSVACSLRSGGLYFIQNMMVDWTTENEQSWNMERDGIKVKVTYSSRWKNILNQIRTEEMLFEVDDHGKRTKLSNSEDLKFMFPQEFRTLLRVNGNFEFIGWWEGTESTWNLNKPLDQSEHPRNINMVLLRRI
jgi:SAM-dependent methyltransferase